MVFPFSHKKLIFLSYITGFVENMGAFVCTHCGETSHLFGDFARDWARDKSVPFLGSVPLEKEIMVRSELVIFARYSKSRTLVFVLSLMKLEFGWFKLV